MLRTICLSKEAYKQFVQNELFNEEYEIQYKDLNGWVNQSKDYFDIQLIGYNYFLSKNLELHLKQGHNCENIIKFIYSLADHMFFVIEEFDDTFIDRLIRHQLPKDLNTLDEDLLENYQSYSWTGM
jgi:hypothetical protein